MTNSALEAALRAVPTPVQIVDPDGVVLWCNPASARLAGGARVGRSAGEAPHPDGWAPLLRGISEQSPWRGRARVEGPHGDKVETHLVISRAETPGGPQYVLVQNALTDVMGPEPLRPPGTPPLADELSDLISRLRYARARNRAMFDSVEDGVLVVDFDTALPIDVNPAAERIFGYTVDELLGLTGRQLSPPEAKADIDRLSAALHRDGRAAHPRLALRRKDGSGFFGSVRIVCYEVDGRREYVSLFRDVTDQVQREEDLTRSNRQLLEVRERLVRSARLAQLGEIAAGVAHEVNNPAQFVALNLQVIQDGYLDEIERLCGASALSGELDEIVTECLVGIERIRGITRKLLPFARGDEEIARVDVNEVIDESCKMVATELRHRARLVTDRVPLPALAAYRGRLVELVTNLLVNAAHAIPEGDAEAHTITVGTRLDGGAIRLWVEDTGTGVPAELRERIFDPFFSTKPKDRGTGLGLPLCSEIALSHGGTLYLASEPGEPTRMEVQLPLASPLSPAEGERALQLERPVHAVPAPGRVLLVDDEPLLLKSYRRGLAGEYEVVTARDGTQALELLQEGGHFDAILLDVMMPVMDGRRVYEQLEGIDPAMLQRVVFCTGGAFTTSAQRFLSQVPNLVLEKPVSVAQLRDAIEHVRAVAGK